VSWKVNAARDVDSVKMQERNFSWHLHSIKENETNFLQNEINGPQNVLKLKANEMAESQNDRTVGKDEITG